MTFKPSDNEESYFARLELERRRAAEERRARRARPGEPAQDEAQTTDGRDATPPGGC